MSDPKIELIPSKTALCVDAAITLDVLIRIAPPPPATSVERSPLNLALVLDRSGSMAGRGKMHYAQEAAAFAVWQLHETDRVSVTVFDEHVDTLVRNAPALDKTAITESIQSVLPRGSTALYDGWLEGSRQAASGLIDGGMNRVLLLSDGLANHGVTDSKAIALKARELADQGVSTTTLGVGDDYNEDLMEAMAKTGDGNYYYIQDPVQLTDIFQTELQGLVATFGQKVSIGLDPVADLHTLEMLNKLEGTETGRLKLPNLVFGQPIQLVVRLHVPPRAAGTDLISVRLAWDTLDGNDRRVLHATLRVQESIPKADWDLLPADPAVEQHVALLMLARAQNEATTFYDTGDFVSTRRTLEDAAAVAARYSSSPEVNDELAHLSRMMLDLEEHRGDRMRKQAKYRSYSRFRGSPSAPVTNPDEQVPPSHRDDPDKPHA